MGNSKWGKENEKQNKTKRGENEGGFRRDEEEAGTFVCTPAYIGIIHQQFMPPLGLVEMEAKGGRGKGPQEICPHLKRILARAGPVTLLAKDRSLPLLDEEPGEIFKTIREGHPGTSTKGLSTLVSGLGEWQFLS
jgi:hypothetical protein